MLSKHTLIFLAFAVIISVPLFDCLDAAPLQQWDESRLATSAFEMSHSHNWIVTTFNDAPDMWSTKPPLLIWLQAIMIKLFGVSELAVRLPSALAALCTCCIIIWFFSKKYKLPIQGGLSALVLVTSCYVNFHFSRTADYDAMLTLFMFSYAVCFFLYLEEQRKDYLTAFFAFLILAALTKGVESLLFLPGLLVYAMYKKKVRFVFTQKETYFGLLAFIFFVFGYYLLRERFNPGYISAVVQNELTGRYNTVIENHKENDFYYFNVLANTQFQDWYLLLLPGIVVGFLSRNTTIRTLTVFSFLMSFCYLLIISGAQTKVFWYTMPVLPFLSIIVGIFLYLVYEVLSELRYPERYLSINPLPIIFVFLIFILPYTSILNFCCTVKAGKYYRPEQADMAQFLKNVLHHDYSADSFVMLNTEYQQNYNWYIKVLKSKNLSVGFIDTNRIHAGLKVAVSLPETKKYLGSLYKTKVVQTFGYVTIYEVSGKRDRITDSLAIQ